MAEEGEDQQQQQTQSPSPIRPCLPTARVKKIVYLDRDIKRVNSEALLLITSATQLFVRSLADRSARVASEKKRKTVKLEHLRLAVKRHSPTSDFLLDSLPPAPSDPGNGKPDLKARSKRDSEKPVPQGVRTIDDFFGRTAGETAG